MTVAHVYTVAFQGIAVLCINVPKAKAFESAGSRDLAGFTGI